MTSPLKVLQGGGHDLTSAWTYLVSQSGTLVRCAKDKRAIDGEWQKKTLSIHAVMAHINDGGLIGIVPGTIGWWVIDQDKGHPDIIANEIEHVAFTLPSRTEGNYHHWVRRKPRRAKNREIGNSKWNHQDCAGEIRGDKGYVVVWDVMELVSCLKTHSKHPKIDPDGCPILRRAPIAGTLPTKTPRVRKGRAPSRLDDFVWDQLTLVRTSEEGERNENLNTAVYTVYKRGYGGTKFDADIAAEARHAGLTEAEITTTIESAKKAGVRDHIGEDAEDPVKLGEAMANAMREAQSDLRRYKDKTLDQVEQALADLGYRFRFNTLTGRVESQQGANFWEDVSNNTATIRRRLECECLVETAKGYAPFHVPRDRFDDLMAVYANDPTRRQNPLVEWARRLPAWDGVGRMESVFTSCFGANDDELTRWAGRYLFTAALVRSATADNDGSGYSLDQMLFLIGPGGIGKSRFLKCAVPQRMVRHWVCSDFSMAAKDKEKQEKILGKVFIEVPEITFDRFFSVDALKAFLSVTHDEVRLPYQRRTESFPRTATFVATLNHQDGLPDDHTGNRRFVPIVCTGMPAGGERSGAGWTVTEWWDHNRDQLWAEAWALAQKVIAGTATLEMSPSTRVLHAEHYEASRITDESFEEAIPEAAYQVLYDQLAADPEDAALKFDDIYHRMGEDMRKRTGVFVAMPKELRRAGWTKKRMRLGGGRSNPANRWIPQQELVEETLAKIKENRDAEEVQRKTAERVAQQAIKVNVQPLGWPQ